MTVREDVWKARRARDDTIERDYNYARDEGPPLSTLAFVSLHREDLTNEFLTRPALLQGDLERNLGLWELERFGHRLEPSAHGVLLASVREATKGVPPP